MQTGHCSPPTYTDAAVKFIETPSVDPFFMYLGFSYPHVPIDASPRFKGKSRFGIYGDAVEEIDWSVGQILDALKRRGLDDNTLVMFTSDHGPWYRGMPGPHRGRKGTSFEGGCRVPFLARWSGHIPAGHVCDAGASNLDILPTLATICGAHLPAKPLDGTDISSLLSGGKVEPERADPLLYFSALRAGVDLQCARIGKWKLRISQYTKVPYILSAEVGDNILLARPELFDLEDDPGESYDLASVHPEIVAQIEKGISRSIGSFPPNVLHTYEALLKNPGKPSTFSGAPPQPLKPSATAAPEEHH